MHQGALRILNKPAGWLASGKEEADALLIAAFLQYKIVCDGVIGQEIKSKNALLIMIDNRQSSQRDAMHKQKQPPSRPPTRHPGLLPGLANA